MMKPSIISASLLLVTLAGLVSLDHVHSSPASGFARGPNQQVNVRTSSSTSTTTTTTTTTEAPASGVVDDPMNSAATTSESTPDSPLEEICVSCYEKVKVAQDMAQVHDNIARKLKKLINRKRAATEAAATTTTSTNTPPRSNKIGRSANTDYNSQHNSTLTVRTLENQPELIVVSRLRVARSPETDGQVQQQQQRPSNKDKHWQSKRDAEIERLQREQQRQKEITCKSVNEVHGCIDRLQEQCIGDLQFHSYEVFSDQLFDRLRCPFPNHPNLKPWRVRTLEDETKVPVARPITSPEEVRIRLDAILPNRVFPRPLGVILTPKPNPNPLKQDQTQSMGQMKGSYRYWTQPNHSVGDNSLAVGRILLIPVCFAILIALIAALHYKRPWEYEKKFNSAEQDH